MNLNMKTKLSVDVVLLMILLPLMGYHLFGRFVHEWLGAGMLILFILHTMLNIQWYKNLFRGEYTCRRLIGTLLNLAVLAAMLCIAYSGIILSKFVFAFLSLHGGRGVARMLHLASSYWGFVLMGLHLGFHWEMLKGILRRALSQPVSSPAAGIMSRAAVFMVSLCGVYAFIDERIADSLFLTTHFAFFNHEQSGGILLGKYLAMLVLFAALGHYGMKLIGWGMGLLKGGR